MQLSQVFKWRIIQLAIPLILSNITVPLLGLSNTAVLGHLSSSLLLAALGLGDVIFDTLYWAFGFLRMGTTGAVAVAYGKKDYRQLSKILSHSAMIALLVAGILIVLQAPLLSIIFQWVGGSDEVHVLTSSFFNIRIWGAPAALINYVLLGTLIGLQQTRAVLLVSVMMNLTAIMVSVALVFGFGMTIAGVAWADIAAQYLGALLGAYILLRTVGRHVGWQYFRLDWHLMRRLVSANTNIFIRTICLIFSMMFFTAKSATLGAMVLAANTVLMNFISIMGYAQDGFANVTEALIGEKVGNQDCPDVFQTMRDTLVWSCVVGVFFTLLYSVIGRDVVVLLTSYAGIVATASQYLVYVMWVPVLACIGFYLDGVCIGAGEFASMRNSMVMAMLGYLALWYFFTPENNRGLWVSLLGYFALRSVVLAGIIGWRILRKTFAGGMLVQ